MTSPISRRSLLKVGAAATAGTLASTRTLAYELDAESTVEITIKRDEYGVPHIYARDGDGPEGVFYGYGYATARDRLYQLELYRRYYHGTVAEVLGEEWIEFDHEARLNHDSVVSLEDQIDELLDDEHRAVLQAYADGINRHIEEVQRNESDRDGFHRGFIEHDFEPDTWDVTDVAGVFVATMSFFSGVNLESLNAAILAGLEAEHDEETARGLFDDLQWGDDPDAPTSGGEPNPGFTPPTAEPSSAESASRIQPGPTGENSNLMTGGESQLTADPERTFERQQERLRTLVEGAQELGIPTTVGSNALAVHGEITESGDHLLMGGPQMEFSTPSVMYEVGLHGPDFDVSGITVTGYPAIMFGHNEDGAFTSTAGVDKSIQTFVESIRTNEDGPDEYEFRGEWDEMDERELAIGVADGEDVSRTLRRTRHGVVTEYDPDAGEAIAQTRAYDGRDMNALKAYYDAQFADNVDAYGEAAQQCDYSLNFMWAGGGGIGFFHLGRYPDFESVPWDTRLPADGTEHELTEEDFLRAADGEVPYSINPSVGYSAQWNNKPAPNWNNGDRSYSWGVDNRVQRFIELVETDLNESGSVSYDDLKEMVYDTSFVDLRAIRYETFLHEALADADLSEIEQNAADAVAEWDQYRQADGEQYMGQYPAGYSVFDEFFSQLLTATFEPMYGDQFDLATILLDFRYGRGTLMRALYPDETALETAVDYFNDDRDGVILSAFRNAVDTLREEYGDDVSEWRADVQIDDLENVVLFGMPVGIGDSGEMPFVNRGTENHFVQIGESDIRAENVLPPGNSGYISPEGELDEHYNDQLDAFINFEYKELLFTDDAVESASRSEIKIDPTASIADDEEADPSDAEASTETSDEEASSPSGPEDDRTSGDSVPGFGAGAAIAGIGAAGLLKWLADGTEE